MSAVQKIESQEVAVAGNASLMEVIMRAAKDKDMDVGKLDRLLDMHQRMCAVEAEQKFNVALTKAQAEMPMVIKKSVNPQTGSKYAKLEAVKIAIAPKISEHGFSLMFSEGKSDNPLKIRVLCDIRHDGGHSIQRHLDLSPDDTGQKGMPSKTKIHGEGSTFSYGCRYLTTMIFNIIIIGEDNDGNQGKPRPTGPVTVSTDKPDYKKQLWTLLKPVRGAENNWHEANIWLWDADILDAAAQEEAPKLTDAQFIKVIEAATKKLQENQ